MFKLNHLITVNIFAVTMKGSVFVRKTVYTPLNGKPKALPKTIRLGLNVTNALAYYNGPRLLECEQCGPWCFWHLESP